MTSDKIKSLISRLKKAESELLKGVWIKNIIIENQVEILELNYEVQLFEKGITAHGVDISSFAPYSPYTIQLKKIKGQPTDRVTLRDEGDFQDSFYLEVNNEQFEIKALDWKTKKLTFQYGEEILGLTDENLEYVIREYIFHDVLEKLKTVIYEN